MKDKKYAILRLRSRTHDRLKILAEIQDKSIIDLIDELTDFMDQYILKQEKETDINQFDWERYIIDKYDENIWKSNKDIITKSKEEPILRLVNKHILNPKIKTKNSNRPSTGILDSSLLIQLKYTSGGTVEKSREQLKKGSIAYLSKGWFEVFKTFGKNPEVRHSQFERFFDNRIKQLLKDEIIKSPEPGVFQLVKRLTTDDWRLIESILTLPPHKDLRLTKLKF
ncbi:MAG: hypothetical protein MK012_04930 [Dehalococcoidia bacterium]|nr:hypothetical protein [Dehalococcoidia bacterium]|tara:strand:- start:2418 stop:3092 length:675 start_codon:yes stop_codon:yes gene_type:complete